MNAITEIKILYQNNRGKAIRITRHDGVTRIYPHKANHMIALVAKAAWTRTKKITIDYGRSQS